MRQLSVRIDDETAKALKVRTAQYDTSTQAILEEAIKRWLEEHPPK